MLELIYIKFENEFIDAYFKMINIFVEYVC